MVCMPSGESVSLHILQLNQVPLSVGMELQRLRNARGLKPSQLARLAGHHAVARLLSEVNISTTPQTFLSAAPSSSGAPIELPRRIARAALPARAGLPTRQEPTRLPAGFPERGGVPQEALLAALTQRARLLLSLRASSLSLDGGPQDTSSNGSEVRRPRRLIHMLLYASFTEEVVTCSACQQILWRACLLHTCS